MFFKVISNPNRSMILNRCFQSEWVLTEIKGTTMSKKYQNSMKIKLLRIKAWVAVHEVHNPKCLPNSGQLLSRGQTVDKSNSDK